VRASRGATARVALIDRLLTRLDELSTMPPGAEAPQDREWSAAGA
jgi:hypothetical protein